MKTEAQTSSMNSSRRRALPGARRLADGRIELLPQVDDRRLLMALWEAVAEGRMERMNDLKQKLAQNNEPP